MPRVSKGPRYYPSKGAWYATLDGKTMLLVRGPKKETAGQAMELYDAEVAARKVEVEGDRNSVWAVVNAYLLDLDKRVKNQDNSPGLLRMHTYILTAFNQALGRTRVRDLRRQQVSDWLASKRRAGGEASGRRKGWGHATEKLARDVVMRVFTWAVEEADLLSAHPLKKREAGKKRKRRKQRPVESRVAISEHEHRLLVEQATRRSSKGFLHLLRFLYATGARPAEMYGVTAAEWEPVTKAFRIRATPENLGRYKMVHLGEDRLVYIPDELVPLVDELRAAYPDGPLIRNEREEAWNNRSLCSRFTSIKRAANHAAEKRGVAGVRKEVTAYAYRHGYVTEWLKNDRSVSRLCQLLNTSEAMLRKHYNHLFQETEALREVLNGFRSGRAG